MNFKLFIKTLYLSLLVFSSCKSIAQSSITLCSNNTASYKIFTTGQPDETKAAQVLQTYLQKISGTSFDIASTKGDHEIYILTAADAEKILGDKSFNLSPLQSIFIKVTNGNLLLIGKESSDVLNVVYEFLEKYLGCRYYTADAVNIPSQKTISIPAATNYTFSPPVKYRFIYAAPAFKGEYAAFNKLQNIQNNKFAPPGWGIFVHSMFTLVPPAKYFKDHPEYYALVNGKRVATQLDLTNPEVLKIAQAALADIIQKNPTAKYFSVSQMDNKGYCQCNNCKQKAAETGSQSGIIVDFVNKLAAAFPSKIISTLAYEYSRPAPTNIAPAKNVNIMFCATGVNRSVSFMDDQSKGSVYADLQAWSKITGSMFFWDYVVDFKHLYIPFPVWNTLQPNMQFITKNKVDKLIVQSWTYNGSDMPELKTYLLSKLLWDPGIDIKTTQTDFLNFYYGKAAPFIAKYLDDLNNYVQSNKINLTTADAPLDHAGDYLSPTQIKIYSQDFNEAKNAVAGNTTYLDRVQNAEQSVTYAILNGTSKIDQSAGNTPAYENLVQDFKNVATKAGVKSIDDGGNNSLDSFVAEQEIYQKNKFTNSLATNASAEIINPASYTVSNINNLFDKVAGTKTVDSKWIKFQQPSIELVIDLKASLNIDSISARFMHNPFYNVQLPVSIKYSVSVDGKNYSPVGTANNLWAGLGMQEELKTFTLNIRNKTSARYIKMNFSIVAPFSAEGISQSMLCDEIIVR